MGEAKAGRDCTLGVGVLGEAKAGRDCAFGVGVLGVIGHKYKLQRQREGN